MTKALKGLNVLVTRPLHQSENLCRLIEQEGGVAIRFHTLQIQGLDEDPSATKLSPRFSKFRWLIFTSANAVNFALKANSGKIEEFKAAQIAAIGKATAAELESVGLEVNLIPKNGYDSESLLDMPQLQEVDGQYILILRGQGGREELAKVLRSRGAKIEYWEVYKRVAPVTDPFQVNNLLEQGLLGIITITSCEALQNLVVMLEEKYKESLAKIPLVVISNRISQLAAELGFTKIMVTESPSDRSIVDTIISSNMRGNTRMQ